MLIARDHEKEILSNAYSSDESKLIAIYGRRRIGKTYLVREVFNNIFTFQHSGYYGGTKEEELFTFSKSISEYGNFPCDVPNNWLEAFELLKEVIRKSDKAKKVIFLDELSWMDTPKSDFLMALEGFWNGWASARKDVLLIVCGSVTSWMLKKIIHNKGGLYNRLSERIHLQPFSLKECEELLEANGIVLNRYQILEGYMIFGGVPYYWGFIKKGMSLEQNIDAIFFSKNALLDGEFKYLYSSLFKNPAGYIKIVAALAKKKIGMTREELLSAIEEGDSGRLSSKLDELESCGFIRKYNQFGNSKKKCVYQLIDNFTLFYYKYLEKRPGDEHFWSNNADSSSINAWCGLAFERICLQHVSQIKNALGISGVASEEFSFRCNQDAEIGLFGSQIDLLICRKDQITNLCEIKYSRNDFTITSKVDNEIRNKVHDFKLMTKSKNAVHPILITTYGLANGAYAGSVQKVITAEDLFKM